MQVYAPPFAECPPGVCRYRRRGLPLGTAETGMWVVRSRAVWSGIPKSRVAETPPARWALWSSNKSFNKPSNNCFVRRAPGGNGELAKVLALWGIPEATPRI